MYLEATSRKLTKTTKSYLGIQLRSVQTKGMLMLISLFFTLIALYIFFRIVNITQLLAEQLCDPENKKNSTNVEDSAAAITTLWLLITIIAWLLLPIFKLVKDEDINLKAPYKEITLAGNSGPDISSPINNYSQERSQNKDTLIIINRNDTIHVKLIDEGKMDSISPEILRLLNNIKQQVENGFNKREKIKL